jgi:hypothetical protein
MNIIAFIFLLIRRLSGFWVRKLDDPVYLLYTRLESCKKIESLLNPFYKNVKTCVADRTLLPRLSIHDIVVLTISPDDHSSDIFFNVANSIEETAFFPFTTTLKIT